MNKRTLCRPLRLAALPVVLMTAPLASLGAPIFGVQIINSAESVGSGELMQIQTRTSPLEVANLIVGWGSGNTGALTVSGGGRVEIDGTPNTTAAGVFPGMSIARQSGSTGSVRVDGAGSTITFKGNTGFLNVAGGNASDNGTGSLEVVNGAVVSGGGGTNDFVVLNVGGGATTSGSGSVLISGTGSRVQLAGTFGPGGPDEGGGPGVNVGRGSGSGSVTVSGGGVLSIDATIDTPSTFGPFINIGRTSGASGQFNITGPGSQVVMTSDSLSPSVMVGRGGVGGLAVTNGALLQMNGNGSSTPTVFNTNQLRIGGDGGSLAGTGIVTVSGSGSRIELNGNADRFVFIGGNTGATGTLDISGGGYVSALFALVGHEGGTGTLNLDGGTLSLKGVGSGPMSNGIGAGLGVGRGTGSLGTLSMVNGSSLVIDAEAGVNGGISVGGTPTAPGGTGSMSVLGGSTVTVLGSGLGTGIYVGNNSGTGTMNVGGAGTVLDVSGVSSGGRVMVGNNGAIGSLTVTDSALINAGALFGVAHNGVGDTGGAGTVMIGNGASVAATDIHLGPAGVIGGTGTLFGNVTNHGGLISPGFSAGELTIAGNYGGAGTFLMEIFENGSGFVVDTVRFSTPGATLDFSNSIIQFQFVGAANPLDFLLSDKTSLSDFLNFEPDAVVGFDGAQFNVSADKYRVNSFQFTVAGGFTGFDVSAVPEPGTLLLTFLGLSGLILRRRRDAFKPETTVTRPNRPKS